MSPTTPTCAGLRALKFVSACPPKGELGIAQGHVRRAPVWFWRFVVRGGAQRGDVQRAPCPGSCWGGGGIHEKGEEKNNRGIGE